MIAGLLPYLAPPVYRFPTARPFSGARFWNPYADVQGQWRRANFHAHGQAWGGATNGAQDDAQVITAYRAAGYDIPGVSNYQSISPLDLVPAYEHGYNVGKHHQLALGATGVLWWDFPLWQGLNEKQYVLEQLRPSTALIAINHPGRRHSYTLDDVRALSGYDLIEIANGHLLAEDRWDAALSSGHPVLGIGGDDTHDVTDRDRFAVAWTMVAASSLTASHILTALREGRSYVVVSHAGGGAGPGLGLASVTVNADRLTVTLSGASAGIDFIGQDGRLRQSTPGTTASYAFSPADTYIRTVVHGAGADLYFNPVIRTGAARPRPPDLPIDQQWTYVRRIVIGAAIFAIALALRRR